MKGERAKRYLKQIDLIEARIEIEKETGGGVEDLIEEKRRIIKEIQSMEDARYIKILYMRYVEHKKLEKIAAILNYDYQYTRYLHGQALQAFEAVLSRKEK